MAERRKRKPGGQEKISDALVDKIVKMVREGAYYCHAAGAAGITKQTLYNWKARGEADIESGAESLYRELVERIRQAEDEAVVDAEKRVFAAGKRDYKAAIVYLSKRRPDVWGDKVVVEFDAGLDKVLENMSTEELELLDRMFEKAQSRADQSKD